MEAVSKEMESRVSMVSKSSPWLPLEFLRKRTKKNQPRRSHNRERFRNEHLLPRFPARSVSLSLSFSLTT